MPIGKRAAPFEQRGHRLEKGRTVQRHEERVRGPRIHSRKGTTDVLFQGGLQNENANYHAV